MYTVSDRTRRCSERFSPHGSVGLGSLVVRLVEVSGTVRRRPSHSLALVVEEEGDGDAQEAELRDARKQNEKRKV